MFEGNLHKGLEEWAANWPLRLDGALTAQLLTRFSAGWRLSVTREMKDDLQG